MFRDLKEYQDITKIYQSKVYTEDYSKEITEAFESEEFTEEEAAYIKENFDALIEEVIAEEEESLSEQMTGRQRGKALRQKANEIISDIRKPTANTTKVSSKAIQGKPAGVVGKFKSALSKVGSKIKDVAKTAVKTGAAPLKSGGAVSKMGAAAGKSGLAVKGAKVLSKMGTAGKLAAGAALVGGALIANRKKIKAAADKAKGEKITKQVDKYVADRKGPINKVKYPVQQGKAEDPKVTTTEVKPVKKMGRIEKANRERLGDDRVDALKKKNAEFQAAKKSGNLAQFRKDNPKMSGADRAKQMAKDRLAKKAEMSEGIVGDAKELAVDTVKKGVKAVANKAGSVGKMVKNTAVKVAKEVKKGYDAQEGYTPYDIVLEYLLSSEQAATIEEANYVMTEMDAETIQGIVEMQGQINRADIIGGTPAAKNAAAGKGKYTPGKGVTKDFKLDPTFKLPKV